MDHLGVWTIWGYGPFGGEPFYRRGRFADVNNQFKQHELRFKIFSMTYERIFPGNVEIVLHAPR